MRWPDIVATVRRHFAVVITGDDWLGIRHSSSRDDDPDAVKVKVAMVSAVGLPHVQIVAEVFAATMLDATAALALNHELSIGALQLEDGLLLLAHVLPVAGLDEVVLRRAVLYIARQAEHMRQVRRPAIDPRAFEYLVD